jgi:hypothetical protein
MSTREVSFEKSVVPSGFSTSIVELFAWNSMLCLALVSPSNKKRVSEMTVGDPPDGLFLH